MKKIIIFLFLFVAMISSGFSISADDRLIAHYPLYNNASDMSGNGYHGTNNGATFSGSYADFDGTNDYIDISSHISAVSSQTQGTICFNANHDVTSDPMAWGIGDSGNANSRARSYISSGDSKYYFQLNDNGWINDVISDSTLSTGTNYTICITNDGTTTKMYIDASVQTDTDSGEWMNDMATLDTWRLGVRAYSLTNWYNGS